MIHTVAMQFALLTHRDWSTACRTAGEKCGLKRKQRLMAHPPDAVKPTPWGEQPHFYTSEATMSEKRYSGTFNGIYDATARKELYMSAAADELNRLAAQVASLRELLNEARLLAWKHGEIVLFTKLEAAIKQSFDNQERGDEATRHDAEE